MTTPPAKLGDALPLERLGREMHTLARGLYPLCRSITGDGVRQTLEGVRGHVPIHVEEVPTGTPVFDWTVPREWNIRSAWVKDPSGKRVIDFETSNLHVVSYSVPVEARMPLSKLREHLHSLPERPDLIPYRTAYYNEDWGFCLRDRDLQALPEGEYEVRIDSTLEEGHLSYGELFLPGQSEDEVLFSAHVCHPSLCNDNLSGIGVATFLASLLAPLSLRYSYRFLFAPGTIGTITWLARNESRAHRIRHGLVLTGVGDAGPSTYKRTLGGDAEVDRAMAHVLEHAPGEGRIVDFSPFGYDERQYNSPGFRLPVGCLMRTPHGTYPEYHTSGDDLDFLRPESLADSLAKVWALVGILERNGRLRNTNPKCEPQLGRRGLFRAIGGVQDVEQTQYAMLWVLSLSDGESDLLGIAERSGIPFEVVRVAANHLLEASLLEPVEPIG